MSTDRVDNLSMLTPVINTSCEDVQPVHAWGVPVPSVDVSNMSDDEYLERILGPQRMGYQVMQMMIWRTL